MTDQIEVAELHNQPVIKLQTPDGAVALVSLFGAQVLSWTPAGGEDRLYLSPQAVFDGRSAIRGGVPVCFPQFGDRGPLPRHGFARQRRWVVSNTRAGKEYAVATLSPINSTAAPIETPAFIPRERSATLSAISRASAMSMPISGTYV